ncbi:hypothetical protein Poly41_68240 [Novipirellula artificiosorum]|uniref:Uncharacterized protein n=1 Tax=Novipirellula artificiosorum TaxID=2528016 RepID=A0A5C6CV46_9BACT|nr:hypothetical protein Poly41_68240 [Novipirellula artificiosorum]
MLQRRIVQLHTPCETEICSSLKSKTGFRTGFKPTNQPTHSFYYNAEINPGFHLTGDIQVIETEIASQDTALDLRPLVAVLAAVVTAIGMLNLRSNEIFCVIPLPTARTKIARIMMSEPLTTISFIRYSSAEACRRDHSCIPVKKDVRRRPATSILLQTRYATIGRDPGFSDTSTDDPAHDCRCRVGVTAALDDRGDRLPEVLRMKPRTIEATIGYLEGQWADMRYT